MAPPASLNRRPRPESLSDDALLARLAEILGDSRRAEADLVSHIAEVDARRLYLREACASMFSYCVERLHLSEPETALRIVVARAARRHPPLLEMLRDGRLHLSGIALLAPHLGEADRDRVVSQACHLSKRQIEHLVASLAPRPDVPAAVRRLPSPPLCFGAAAVASAPASVAAPVLARALDVRHRPDDVAGAAHASRSTGETASQRPLGEPAVPLRPRQEAPAAITPLAPARYRVQFTASAELKAKLDRLRQLMRRPVPDGDIATLIETAVTEKIARLEARRLAATSRPRREVAESDTRPGPRHIPAAVKRAVRTRDGDRCAYVDSQGRRCASQDHLEFHHRVPHAWNGDRSPSNIALYCRGHNAFEARSDFGTRALARATRGHEFALETPPTRAVPSAAPADAECCARTSPRRGAGVIAGTDGAPG